MSQFYTVNNTKSNSLSKGIGYLGCIRSLKQHTLFVLLALSFFSFNETLFAQQSIRLPAGARSAAIGRTGLNFTDIYAAFRNQAGLGNIRS
ncbi:MAG: hypothetical protein AB8G22_20595, partial [Saprospiraceae bacterium]